MLLPSGEKPGWHSHVGRGRYSVVGEFRQQKKMELYKLKKKELWWGSNFRFVVTKETKKVIFIHTGQTHSIFRTSPQSGKYMEQPIVSNKQFT